MYRSTLFLLTAYLVTFSSFVFSAEEGFPGRKKFPDVKYIEIGDLNKRQARNEVIIVDARSNYEFETLRIKGAVNIPVANKSFEEEVKKLREKTDKTLVFYCNGHRCMKSYIAAKRCMQEAVDRALQLLHLMPEFLTGQKNIPGRPFCWVPARLTQKN